MYWKQWQGWLVHLLDAYLVVLEAMPMMVDTLSRCISFQYWKQCQGWMALLLDVFIMYLEAMSSAFLVVLEAMPRLVDQPSICIPFCGGSNAKSG